MVNPQPGAPRPDTMALSRHGHSPFLFFDGARTFGFNDGVAHITLEALSYVSVEGEVKIERVVVAELRTSSTGLEALKAAITGIELLASRSQSEVPN